MKNWKDCDTVMQEKRALWFGVWMSRRCIMVYHKFYAIFIFLDVFAVVSAHQEVKARKV
jgi:hypothetical protein